MKCAMLGDSITAGGYQWRYKMQQLRPDFEFVGSFGTDPYKHDGVAGDNTRGGLLRIDDVPACDKLLILLGTNDAGVIYWTETLANMQAIVDAAIARGMAPYVCALLPRCDNSLFNEIAMANNYIWRLNLKRATILSTDYAIVSSGFAQELIYTDCLHLTKVGYNVLANYCAPRL